MTTLSIILRPFQCYVSCWLAWVLRFMVPSLCPMSVSLGMSMTTFHQRNYEFPASQRLRRSYLRQSGTLPTQPQLELASRSTRAALLPLLGMIHLSQLKGWLSRSDSTWARVDQMLYVVRWCQARRKICLMPESVLAIRFYWISRHTYQFIGYDLFLSCIRCIRDYDWH